jgi:hypothetical protein
MEDEMKIFFSLPEKMSAQAHSAPAHTRIFSVRLLSQEPNQTGQSLKNRQNQSLSSPVAPKNTRFHARFLQICQTAFRLHSLILLKREACQPDLT